MASLNRKGSLSGFNGTGQMYICDLPHFQMLVDSHKNKLLGLFFFIFVTVNETPLDLARKQKKQDILQLLEGNV